MSRILLVLGSMLAALLSGEAEPQAQVQALGRQFGTVIIKRGALGAVLGRRDGIVLDVPAPRVEVVDSTGAGDAFAAGFIAAQLAGRGATQTIADGVARSARAVQPIGGQPG